MREVEGARISDMNTRGNLEAIYQDRPGKGRPEEENQEFCLNKLRLTCLSDRQVEMACGSLAALTSPEARDKDMKGGVITMLNVF